MKIINPNDLPCIDYRSVQLLQGDLKTLSQKDENKLLNSIENNGFFVPIIVWFDKSKVAHCIDGHQRIITLTKHEVEPFEIPYIEILAKSRKEAKQRLLVITSQYGKIDRDNMIKFVKGIDNDWLKSTLSYEGVNIDRIAADITNAADTIDVAVKDVKPFESGSGVITDHGHVHFDLPMREENRKRLYNLINAVKQKTGFKSTEDCLMYIVDHFDLEN